MRAATRPLRKGPVPRRREPFEVHLSASPGFSGATESTPLRALRFPCSTVPYPAAFVRGGRRYASEFNLPLHPPSNATPAHGESFKARRRTPKRQSPDPRPTSSDVAGLRIVGGEFRGSRLRYSGDPRVRPMKDRVREAVFNLLGPAIRGSHAVDLFAGTGALGLEALSRGASGATFVEQHYPTARIVRQNITELSVENRSQVVTGNVFVWAMHPVLPQEVPWTLFCSPPYAFFVDRKEAMLRLIHGLMQRAPLGSTFVVESDDRFRSSELPQPDAWAVRAYPPAIVGIYHKTAGESSSA